MTIIGPNNLVSGRLCIDFTGRLDIWLTSDAQFTIYDDDERAHTEEIVNCRATRKGSQIKLEVGPSKKTYIAKFNRITRPARVSLNAVNLPRRSSHAELEKADQGWCFDPPSMLFAKFKAAGEKSTLMFR